MRHLSHVAAVAFVLAACMFAAQPNGSIKLDQAGYLPEAPKVAIVVVSEPAVEFIVQRASDGAVALRGKLSEPAVDSNSGDRVQTADFSALREEGAYYIEVPGGGRSWKFQLAADVYGRAFYLAMRAFYGQRCGTAVDLGPEFADLRHDACHLQGAYHGSSGKTGTRVSAGGWHDAGDYGRYVVNSGISTGTLLWTYEMFPTRVGKIRLNIPESGNGMPDILNEIRWNLDWMLSMQDSDGGVWHKQTSEQFGGFVMPEKDTAISYVIGLGKEPYKTSCATADFAAVMAIAARTYKPFDASYSGRVLEAARKAWSWVAAHAAIAFENPSGVNTGEYGDRNCGDELLWASAELWRSTGEQSFERYLLDHYAAFEKTIRDAGPPSWNEVAPLGLWTYVLGGGKGEAAARIRRDSLAAADAIVARTAANGYRISMTANDYVWGSNGAAANYGVALLVANAMKNDRRYVEAALDNLHYLLGRNTFSLSWVTQVGANSFKHPHHRPSGAGRHAEPWPGLLSGGPNGKRQDPAMAKLPDLPPAKMYLDEQASYASNEVAINWNAPLVFLLAGGLPEK